MNVIKIIAIGLIGAASTLILKKTSSELAALITIATSIIILFLVLPGIEALMSELNAITDKSGIDSSVFLVLTKILGIGFITELGASIASDAGERGISDKLKLAGKIAILLVAMPVFTKLISHIGDIMQ